MITLADITDGTSGAVLEAKKQYGADLKTGDAIVTEINTKLGLKAGRPEEMVGINTYFKGATYYIARVKHFGALTPWNSGESYGTKTKSILAVMVCSVTTGMNCKLATSMVLATLVYLQ